MRKFHLAAGEFTKLWSGHGFKKMSAKRLYAILKSCLSGRKWAINIETVFLGHGL